MKTPCDVCKTIGYHVQKYEYEWRSRDDRVFLYLCQLCCTKVRLARVPEYIPHKQIVKYVLEKVNGKS